MPTNYITFLINAKCKFIFKLIQLSKFNHTQDKMKDIFIFGGQVTSLFPIIQNISLKQMKWNLPFKTL